MLMTIVYRSISVTDLEKAGFQILVKDVDGKLEVRRVFKDGKKYSLEEFFNGLHYLGLELDNLLTLEEPCHHVMLSGKPTNNYRFIGQERSDISWIRGGYASEEAILNSSRMKDMVRGGMQMQRGGDRSKK